MEYETWGRLPTRYHSAQLGCAQAKGAAQHAKFWLTPRKGPPEWSLALGRVRGGRQLRASTGPQNAGKTQLGVGAPEARGWSWLAHLLRSQLKSISSLW